METGIVHDYRITFWGFFQKAIFKPVFKKLAIGCMLVTLNGKIYCQAHGGDDVYTLKFLSAFYVFNGLAAWGAAVFPLQTPIYAAFIYKNTLPNGNSF
jgi:hypothetical protein